jgi:alanine dehydrogenase
MVVKVKEPIASEYRYLRPDLILFTYLHLASDKPLTDALLESGTTGIAYETVQTETGQLYTLHLANEGLDAVRKSRALQYGLNTYRGLVTYQAVAEAFGLEWTEPLQALSN